MMAYRAVWANGLEASTIRKLRTSSLQTIGTPQFRREANALTIGINSRKKAVVLGVVWLVAGSLLYIDFSEHSSPRQIQVARSERRIDEAVPDPKLRFDLLAALQTVKVA